MPPCQLVLSSTLLDAVVRVLDTIARIFRMSPNMCPIAVTVVWVDHAHTGPHCPSPATYMTITNSQHRPNSLFPYLNDFDLSCFTPQSHILRCMSPETLVAFSGAGFAGHLTSLVVGSAASAVSAAAAPHTHDEFPVSSLLATADVTNARRVHGVDALACESVPLAANLYSHFSPYNALDELCVAQSIIRYHVPRAIGVLPFALVVFSGVRFNLFSRALRLQESRPIAREMLTLAGTSFVWAVDWVLFCLLATAPIHPLSPAPDAYLVMARLHLLCPSPRFPFRGIDARGPMREAVWP
ncbi:hypothetical protein EXIGLDRAFT_760109 [Exidia glandulosa HHB12029]|uniref:Uncharacterized protein n=1 Tax=Exidia glandulosa HHB12029 TaxID=1314781 RepID=A0A165PJR9_EXIGL|nr:hypothetical protein EXIGLDRAFT_760109 [Exidia glandulosa HHB12029]